MNSIKLGQLAPLLFFFDRSLRNEFPDIEIFHHTFFSENQGKDEITSQKRCDQCLKFMWAVI